MKTFFRSLFLFFLLLILFPSIASAHQPRIVTSTETIVTDPEISKAYYGKLDGDPHIYKINAQKPFNLYINLLVPDVKGQKKDIAAIITKNGNAEHPIVMLIGANYDWIRFWEKFGRSWYWQVPEFRKDVGAGEYEIKIWNGLNDSKYVLAIGEKENFNFSETLNAIKLIPKIKWSFSNQLPTNFILSPFGFGYVFIMYVLAFGAGFLYQAIIKKIHPNNSKYGVHKNIGKKDRELRLAIGTGLFIIAITTIWHPFLFFLSGFAFFEVVFSWCGIYSILGKSTYSE